MSNMSIKEALAEVLKDMKAMSAEELRVELSAHSNGRLATTLRDAQKFLSEYYFFPAYALTHVESKLKEDLTVESAKHTLDCMIAFCAANDNSYALAA